MWYEALLAAVVFTVLWFILWLGGPYNSAPTHDGNDYPDEEWDND